MMIYPLQCFRALYLVAELSDLMANPIREDRNAIYNSIHPYKGIHYSGFSITRH